MQCAKARAAAADLERRLKDQQEVVRAVSGAHVVDIDDEAEEIRDEAGSAMAAEEF